MSFMALDGVTSFRRLKDVTNTCKHMQKHLQDFFIAMSAGLKKLKTSNVFCRLLCVRIEIDLL